MALERASIERSSRSVKWAVAGAALAVVAATGLVAGRVRATRLRRPRSPPARRPQIGSKFVVERKQRS